MRVFILLLLFSFITIPESSACSCIRLSKSLKKEVVRTYEWAGLVISGQVIDKQIVQPNEYGSSSDPIIYTFEIFETYKGKVEKREVQILSYRDGSYCGYNFEVGNTYLVYSNMTDEFISVTNSDQHYLTSLCNRNNRRGNVRKRELRILNRLQKRSSKNL